MKKLLKEFKEFTMRGNVINLAVGVIIGAAFTAIVTSFTDNIIAPLLGAFASESLNNITLTIGGLTFGIGAFIMSIIDFIIKAIIIFLIVKAMNRLLSVGKKPEAPAAPTTKQCPYCLTEINIEATRCAHCTSEVALEAQAEA